ncbi:MAG: cobyric acid synthase [Clostridia bacterium]|nr:cobyric acid synthase [Clostridia bacterium]
MRGKCLMIQGTASSVGKSVLCAAFLRILRQDGLRAAPFKAQNMSLNSFATKDGLEMGRAQVTQAQAAGMEPDVRMNPVLLKPTSDRRSQVIIEGKAVASMTAMEYHQYKPELRKRIKAIYESLENEVDCVVIEGAGSPAEINLREGDIVNMSMAEAADAPVILVGDIDLGGVFASLYGTVMLLTEEERARVKGVIINKFRGDVKILEPGLRMLEEKIHIPVLGVVPWMDVELEDEDSVTERLRKQSGRGDIDVTVVRLRHISNFTDFQSLAMQPGARVRYAEKAEDLEKADLIILPGTKNTIEDLIDLRSRKMDAAIIRHARRGGMVMGICGGYQMLGNVLRDPDHSESQVPEAAGLGLLDMEVVFEKEKRTVQASAAVDCVAGWPRELNGTRVDGYEIHTGRNSYGPEAFPWLRIDGETDGVMNGRGNVLGTYLHGLFDDGRLFAAIADRIRTQRGDAGKEQQPVSMEEYREREFDRIAAIVRESVDMDAVYRIIHGEDVSCASELPR